MRKREGDGEMRGGVMKFRWRRVSWDDFSKFEERGDFIYHHEIGFNARLNVKWLITLGMAITDRKFSRTRALSANREERDSLFVRLAAIEIF